MLGLVDLLLLGVGAVVGIFATRRLWEIATAGITLWRASPVTASGPAEGETIAVTGTVFVDDTAPLADRLFDDTTGDIGAHVWRAWFADAGRYTYDFDRGEFRQGRNSFAAGITAGRFGVTAAGQTFHVDVSWLDRAYDGDSLSQLEIGDPVSNATLPAIFTRHVFDAVHLSLSTTAADRSMERVIDIVDLHRDDVAVEEFNLESRGIPAGTSLFVAGELRVDGGEWTVVGTDSTPLLLSDEGADGLRRRLWRRGGKNGLWLTGVIAVSLVVVLW